MPKREALPSRYKRSELKEIAKSIGRKGLNRVASRMLQEAVQDYQWGRLVDDRIFPSCTNRGRRKSLKNVIALCEQGAPSEEIELEVNDLDALASQLLRAVDLTDCQKVRSAAEAALKRIPQRGPDPKRARLHFIGDLKCIYSLATGKRPGRWVHDVEGGEFRDFVKAALKPFKATQGCEADIKVALKRSKHA